MPSTDDLLLAQLVKRVAALEKAQRRSQAVAGGVVPACCIHGSVNTTCASGATQQITLDVVDYDTTGTMADTANNGILAWSDGLYVAIANAEWAAAGAVSRRDFRIYKQAVGGGLPGDLVSYTRGSNVTAADTLGLPAVLRPWPALEGERFLLYGNQNSGGDVDVNSSSGRDFTPFLAVWRIGPLP